MQKLITEEQKIQMLRNGRITLSESAEPEDDKFTDHWPVVKLFMPDGGATWLLSEIRPDDHDIAFGLCDLGLGFPELGYVSLSEIASVRGALGLPVERDIHFKATKSLSEYCHDAYEAGRIIA